MRNMEELTQAGDNTLDPSAWVDQYGDHLYGYATSRLRNREAAEEVVQETFLAALRHADQYSGQGAERAWLLGILKRKTIDYIRQRNRTVSLEGNESGDPSEALFDQRGSWQRGMREAGYQPLDSLEKREFWQILQECLQTLPTRQADVFVLREMDDKPTDEICKDLEISASNLWVLLYRARTRLSNCMKGRWQQET